MANVPQFPMFRRTTGKQNGPAPTPQRVQAGFRPQPPLSYDPNFRPVGNGGTISDQWRRLPYTPNDPQPLSGMTRGQPHVLQSAATNLLGAAGVDQTSPQYQAIMQMIEQYRGELDRVNAATEADRSNMLGEIYGTYQQGREQNRMQTEAQLGQAEAAARANVGETLRQAREQLAGVGAVAQPFMLANLAGRLQAQARGQVASERERLTNQQSVMDQQQQQQFLSALLQTYGMTNRQGPDPAMLMAAIQAMAQSGETTRRPNIQFLQG